MKLHPSAWRLFWKRCRRLARGTERTSPDRADAVPATVSLGSADMLRPVPSDLVVPFGALGCAFHGLLRRLGAADGLGHHVGHDEVGAGTGRGIAQLALVAGGAHVLHRVA